MAIIDTHCHLDFPAFDEDRDEVVSRARLAGVQGIVLIGIDPHSWRSTEALAAGHAGFWRAAGIHPNSVSEHWNPASQVALENEVQDGGIVAVGETGIDLYRARDNRDEQIEAFRFHLSLAQVNDLPVIIHQRAAEPDVVDVLKAGGAIRGVLHCFGGDWPFAKQCLELGLMLGIGGVATFPRSADVRDAIGRAPADRLLLETDAPYLAPQGKRGKRNEPAYLSAVVSTIAACRSTTADVIERQTTENALRLFSLDESNLLAGD
jgi:TatD DNase family protein